MFVVSIFLVLCAYSQALPATPKATPEEYRLPQGVVELESYDILLRVDKATFEETFVFEGETTIKLKVLQPTSEIKLHANKLTDVTVTLKTPEDIVIDLENTEFVSDVDTDILTIRTAVPLHGDADYILEFTYKGQFRTREMYGFYQSTYTARDGSKKILGTTQFQPTHARKVFPAFDEPSFKAVFTLTIRHPVEYNAISNTKQSSSVPDRTDANFVITTFRPTPRMSSYLLAFVVSDFTCSDPVTPIRDGGEHSVCSREEASPFRKTAEEVGPKLVEVMQNWTGIKYSETMEKMHQVAIPDFSAGAMENWGLLTYRETGLLWDPDQSSNSYKQSIENVLAHEIAHMWFGNLITTHWWSDTFLNEGFARYFQYFATAEVETNWQLDQQFVTAQIHPMLVSDAQPSATALSSEAFTPSQVSGRFGSVSYNKGASVLRMFEHVMGKTNFKTGVQKYLSDHKLSNTRPEHLWQALQLNVGTTVPTNLATVVDAWINKPGFPLLEVKLNGTTVTISQKRFLVTDDGTDRTQWYVPVTYTLSSDQNKFGDTSVKRWLLPNSDLVLTNILENNDWIILNNQQVGYYRVHYSEELLAKIETALNADGFSGIHPLNRAQLVDDIYNLAKVGTITYKRAFEFFRFLQKDSSYYPWNAAITALSDMSQRTGNSNIRDSLSALFLGYMDTLIKAVPFETPNDNDQIYTFNRVQATTWACRLGSKECTDKAVAEFAKYKSTQTKPDKNLKSVIYCNGLRHSTTPREDFDFLWGEYSSSKLATEQATILSALGCSRDRDVLIDYIKKSIDGTSGIRQQDASSVFSTVYTQNPEGVDIAFDFLLENYNSVSEYYGSMNSLNNMFTGLAARFTTQQQIDRLEAFLNDSTDLDESLESAARSGLANAKANLVWITQFERQLTEYFGLDHNTADSVKVGGTTLIVTILVACYQMLR